MTRYEVQTQLLSGWENTWSDDGAPVTFTTRAEAAAELAANIADCEEAVRRGDLSDFDPRSCGWQRCRRGADRRLCEKEQGAA